ncbi:MAG: ABC transporter permease [Ancrocorticia sp.]|jgi:peptide/nickel transport system permease protein|nr:ABC transporter permease [Ancrocorticia sp.]MCI1896685.1 ABC transporter permease [Ancrocorticia sp.]MCI1933232.1 ABC transporter permease [Ancrocorticia sp.]MCI1963884.1 ABC transporter permease [Ancrocorticia sp.]MCI2001567.1 ABC transporter permease [Ancrocorticia sp.]
MVRYLFRRLGNYIVLLAVAVSLAYMLAGTQLNPRTMLIEQELTKGQNVTYAQVAASVDQRLDKWNINPQTPVWERFGTWIQNVFLHGNWGYSPDGASVTEQLGRRAMVSLQLVVLGFFIGIIVGIAIGAWTAVRQYSTSDRVITAISIILLSTPAMVLAVFLQIGATKLNQDLGFQLINFVGQRSAIQPDGTIPRLLDRLNHLILPTISMSLSGIASYSRYQRNLMLDTLGADYVRTARAKGLRYGTAVRKHALRTSLIPMATYFAFGMTTLVLGAAVTEQVFGWQGMGIYSVTTIQTQDINGTVAVVAFSGVMVLAGALLSDILVAIVDPRVRVS